MLDRVSGWLLRVLVAIDELGNAILGGSPHETISSRLYKLRMEGNRPACWACATLSVVFFQRDHCARAADWINGESLAQVEALERAREGRAA